VKRGLSRRYLPPGKNNLFRGNKGVGRWSKEGRAAIKGSPCGDGAQLGKKHFTARGGEGLETDSSVKKYREKKKSKIGQKKKCAP